MGVGVPVNAVPVVQFAVTAEVQGVNVTVPPETV
jgi:hypothetical protein